MTGQRDSQFLEYPLSPKYVPNWTVGDALRELIANALDTDTKVTVAYRSGYAWIKDAARGIDRSFWVIGEGTHGAIGQFGEGLKVAMLVLAREGRHVEVTTAAYAVRPSIRWSETFGAEVLALEFLPGDGAEGTCIGVRCSPSEFAEARGRFLKLSPVRRRSRKLGILAQQGVIYVNGVFAQHVNTLWGYDISDKTLINRDRTVLDVNGLTVAIRKCLEQLSHGELAEELLNAASQDFTDVPLELRTYFSPTVRSQRTWSAAFHRVYGARACLMEVSGEQRVWDEARHTAKRLGYRLVSLPDGLTFALKYSGVATSTAVVRRAMVQTATPLASSLSAAEQRVWDEARRVAKTIVPDAVVKRTLVVERCPNDGPTCHLDGLYRNGTVYLARGVLGSLDSATGVLIHERLHGLGLKDETVEFENAMTDLIGRLAVK